MLDRALLCLLAFAQLSAAFFPDTELELRERRREVLSRRQTMGRLLLLELLRRQGAASPSLQPSTIGRQNNCFFSPVQCVLRKARVRRDRRSLTQSRPALVPAQPPPPQLLDIYLF